MSHYIDSSAAKLVYNTRTSLKMTQLELSEAAKISLRTIQDLEGARRSSFDESTLIALCRALDLSLNDLLNAANPSGSGSHPNTNQPRISSLPSWKGNRIVVIAVLIILGGVIYAVLEFGLSAFNILKNNNPERKDWITDPQAIIHPITPEWNEWDEKWEGTRSGQIFNYLHYKRTALTGDTLDGEFACSYHYVGGTPQIFISLYSEWEPDSEIRLFEGVVGGDGSLVIPFQLICPEYPGIYRIRVFYTTAFGPIPSFYGAPPLSLVTSPSSAEYIETRLEVLTSLK